MTMEQRRISTKRNLQKPNPHHPAFEKMPVSDYIAAMTQVGLFSAAALVPEHDPAVWAHFFGYKAQFPELRAVQDADVYVLLGRYAFFYDPLDDERAGMNWCLSTSLIDFALPVTFEEFSQDREALFDILAHETSLFPALTDTFSFMDGYPDEAAMKARGLLPMNSPVAVLYPDFTSYLESLTSERRKKYRRFQAQYEEHPLRFEFSQMPLTEAEYAFVVDQLKTRWGDDYLYALCQTLWSMAVAAQRPSSAYVMRVYDKDKLVFLQTLIAKGDTMFCQSIVKDEAAHYDGIAAYTDFECVRALCGKVDFAFFDPSCRTGIDDPESIGIAKRATVNKNRVKPLFVGGMNLPDHVREIMTAQSTIGKPL